MIKRLLLHVTRVISAGWCAVCWLGGASLRHAPPSTALSVTIALPKERPHGLIFDYGTA
jgi:hypothetical protein